MRLWNQFKINNSKYQNSGFNVRYEKGIDKILKKKYKILFSYLRKNYVFPYHINIYIKNSYKVRLNSGIEAFGKFHYYEDKSSYIVIPSKLEINLLGEYTKEELRVSILGSLVHELTHYFQMCLDLNQSDEESEKQADYYRYNAVDLWKL